MKAEEGIELVDRDQLRRYFEQGCKSSSEWGIGSEYENFIFDIDLKRPISYEGPKSISKIFELLINKFCLLYTSPSPRDYPGSRMPSSA